MADEVDPTYIHGFIRQVSDMRLNNLHEGGQGGQGDQTPRSTYPESYHGLASSVDDNTETQYTETQYTTSSGTYWQYQQSDYTAPSTEPLHQTETFAGQEDIFGEEDEPDRPVPCELSNLIPCDAWFALSERRAWMNHIEDQHFGHIYPSRSICWFCEQEFKCSDTNQQARKMKFEERLRHVWDHIQGGEMTAEHMRPDFHILKHLNKHGLIDEQTFNHAMGFYEGPERPGFADMSWQPPERVQKQMRSQMQLHDIQKDERQRKKEKEQQRKKEEERQKKKEEERQRKKEEERQRKKEEERHRKKDTREGERSRRKK